MLSAAIQFHIHLLAFGQSACRYGFLKEEELKIVEPLSFFIDSGKGLEPLHPCVHTHLDQVEGSFDVSV
ncbi:hypothetical protein L1887_10323 [Cichorium endivia]|nr:hypothetical protein L1887_21242 [Cichorium endivia]KAI3520871.1 hypothetical protein L1887_10323 [Cichorium endivia]